MPLPDVPCTFTQEFKHPTPCVVVPTKPGTNITHTKHHQETPVATVPYRGDPPNFDEPASADKFCRHCGHDLPCPEAKFHVPPAGFRWVRKNVERPTSVISECEGGCGKPPEKYRVGMDPEGGRWCGYHFPRKWIDDPRSVIWEDFLVPTVTARDRFAKAFGVGCIVAAFGAVAAINLWLPRLLTWLGW